MPWHIALKNNRSVLSRWRRKEKKKVYNRRSGRHAFDASVTELTWTGVPGTSDVASKKPRGRGRRRLLQDDPAITTGKKKNDKN